MPKVIPIADVRFMITDASVADMPISLNLSLKIRPKLCKVGTIIICKYETDINVE